MPEEPIVIASGSVTIEFSDSFKEQSHGGGKKKHKRDTGRIVRVKVNGQPVPGLTNIDNVEIIYET